VVSLYQGNDLDQSFSKLRELTLRAENADSGVEIHRMTINASKLGNATAIRVAEIYRNGVEWHFVPAGDPIQGGLAEIARSYGLQISSTT
jgi:stress response protein SCP2